ncbi:hypothetical protein GALL_357250 [mine drainage metagenome]|uniref:DUF6969 domain-containing protein n=1 Tax=mine drainage metagenome TaxID=410659 RepID=A0A1J5QRH3_9ZZZZ
MERAERSAAGPEPAAPPPALDAAALPPALRQDMILAGDDYLACRAALGRRGRSLFDDLTGGRPLWPDTHYPRGDVYDPLSHAQYYFHRHREGEVGHFHTFLRPRGMPEAIQPADPAERRPPGDNNALTHFVAIALDDAARPIELFTTNRWVTAETWYRAEDVIALLPRFHIGHDQPSDLLNRWLEAVMLLFRPQIAALLRARDATVERHRHRLPGIAVLEDRGLEVTSVMAVDAAAQIAALQAWR